MQIIGIAGRARSGKTTAAWHLVDQYGFAEYAFASPIKNALEIMLGLDPEQLDGAQKEEQLPWLGVSPRRLMQTLGTEWGRELINRNIWVILAERWLSRMEHATDCGMTTRNGVVFSDVRFENEAAFIRRRGGSILHIIRDDLQTLQSHQSEAQLQVESGDVVIRNNGPLCEFYAKLDDAIARLMTDREVEA